MEDLSSHQSASPPSTGDATRCPLAKIICSVEQFAMGNGTAADAVALILHVRSAVSDQEYLGRRAASRRRATHHLAHYPQCCSLPRYPTYFRVLVRESGIEPNNWPFSMRGARVQSGYMLCNTGNKWRETKQQPCMFPGLAVPG